MSFDRLLLIAGTACMLVALEFGGRVLPRSGHVELGRRVYWTGWASGIPLFLIATWGDPAKTVAIAGFWVAMAIGIAYLLTPYLRFRGQICALGIYPRTGETDAGNELEQQLRKELDTCPR